MVDVIGDGNTQGPEATEGELCDLSADLVSDFSSVVGVLEHNLQDTAKPHQNRALSHNISAKCIRYGCCCL